MIAELTTGHIVGLAGANLAAECDRLKTVNAELLAALELISQIQRNKCESANAETLFMLLDHKVDLACAAIAKAQQETGT